MPREGQTAVCWRSLEKSDSYKFKTFGKWPARQIDILQNPQSAAKTVSPSKKFLAKLRPYQRDGIKWMSTPLHQLSFSGRLADDMGPGKTIQVLAYLDTLEQKKYTLPTLLIVPAFLLADWMNELNYPSLKGEDSCFTDNRLEHKFLGLTSSPRASHPVVPTVGRFLFRQIQYIMIFIKIMLNF